MITQTEPSQGQVILLHGLFHRGLAVSLLAKRLRKSGFSTNIFSYPSRRKDLSTLAQDLRNFADTLNLNEGAINFVGHSLGGLVILTMLEKYSRDLPAGKSVLLGSPVHGSTMAGQLGENSAGRFLLGNARHGLVAGCEYPGGHEIGVIAGIGSQGVGRLLQRLDEPNDGTVTLAETSLAEATDSIEVTTSHFGLLLSPEVARQSAVFLQHGHFD